MAIIIDGYNLLHVTGFVGRAGSGLQGSREALLRFVASAIDSKERAETTIVFDAAEAPPGLPRVQSHDGMTVRYASEYEDADALIEELISANNVPRALTVVSSDHRLQRAARRRHALFVDSDIWFAKAVRAKRRGVRGDATLAPSRNAALSADEIAYWVEEFGDGAEGTTAPPRSHNVDAEIPFPPGYAEDLPEEST